MESSHLDLTSVLDGNKCQHCWDELSGVGFAAFISHVAKGCHYYRIIFMAIDWAVPSLLTFSQIREIRIFHLGSIEIFHGEHEGCETLTVFQTVRDHCLGEPNFERIRKSNILPASTSSDSTFITIENWLRDCITNHPTCDTASSNPPNNSLERIRFISIQGRLLNLVEDSRPTRYACLSHCWGSGKALAKTKTTRRTLKTHIEGGLVFNLLPKTFQDAIKICQRLGIDHLWIDSLCIIQDDDSDWRYQSSRMSDVYKNALVTIAASGSSDSTQGCFSEIHPSYRGEPLPGYPGLYVRRELPSPGAGLEPNTREKETKRNWPLFIRGWVFQELTLSPRVIHFGSQFVGWQCQRCCKCQDYPEGIWTIEDHCRFQGFSRDHKKRLSLQWYDAVKAYSWRKLSFQQDRLPAIAALAKQMLDLRPYDRYIAGLWRSSLLADLMWSVDYHPEQKLSLKQFRERFRYRTSDHVHMPTWSWASVAEPICWSYKLPGSKSDLIEGVEVVNLLYDIDGPVVTGMIKQAAITIRAPFVSLSEMRGDIDIPAEQYQPAVHNALHNSHWPSMDELVIYGVTLDDGNYTTIEEFHHSDSLSVLSMEVFVLFIFKPSAILEVDEISVEAILVTQKQGSEDMVRLGTATFSPLGIRYLFLLEFELTHEDFGVDDSEHERILEGYHSRFVKKLDSLEQRIFTLV